ncbi:hypothetical protein P7M45_24220, partial [Vibrio parahaemolyticus]|nr:hypothetical protein [Vibrio parahaemolyticus]
AVMFACRESILPSTCEMFPMPLAATQAQSMIHLTAHLFYLHQSTGLVSKKHQACFDVPLQTCDAECCGEDTGKVFF